jgi:hypothetical protein
MPALLLRTADVIAAIRMQTAAYSSLASAASLWRQALLRAEWDLPYQHPELGALFLAAAVGGMILLLRSASTAPTAWGWAVWAALSLVLYGTRSFQPFRNLAPLVPVACVAAAVPCAKARERFHRRRGALDACLLLLLLTLWGAPLAAYAWGRARLADSRRLAVDWLAAHVGGDARTLVVRDLGILDTELERVPGRKDVRWWSEATSSIESAMPDFVVSGVQRTSSSPPEDSAHHPAIERAYVLRSHFGSIPTPPFDWWRGNDQIVYVFQRVPARSPLSNR